MLEVAGAAYEQESVAWLQGFRPRQFGNVTLGREDFQLRTRPFGGLNPQSVQLVAEQGSLAEVAQVRTGLQSANSRRPFFRRPEILLYRAGKVGLESRP